MSTASPSASLEDALSALPARTRYRLIKSYNSVKSAFSSHQYDACGLRAGQFCEIMLRILQQTLTGASTPFGTPIANLTDECRKLERVPTQAGPESLRLIVPRALTFLYSLRNKRGIGHVGGDVDANEIDAATAIRVTDWCMCELIRVVHALSLEEAQQILDSIAERQLPEIWDVAGKRRVLNPSLPYRDQALLLLYRSPEVAVPIEDLQHWMDHPNLSNFRRDVLRPLHRDRLIEFDTDTRTAVLSPTGIAKVEDSLLPALRTNPDATRPTR